LQPRPNVIFELGLALGRAPLKTIMVTYGNVDLWSDVLGRHYVHMNNTPAPRAALWRRLRDAGCDMSADTSDYLSAEDGGGNFPPLARPHTLDAS
ncbi:TIR domain-containing protein, partial [Clavibacter michiganensis]